MVILEQHVNRFLALALALLLFSTVSQGEVLKTEADLQPFADQVMKEVGEGRWEKAFGILKPYGSWSDERFQTIVSNSKASRDKFGAAYGPSAGSDFVAKTKRGTSLVRLLYIEKTKNSPVFWYIYFYKSSAAGWVVQNFTWNDQLEQAFLPN